MALVHVTDHGADLRHGRGVEALRQLYRELRALGFDAVRYDWRWELIEPTRLDFDSAQLSMYRAAKALMKEAGLQSPIVVLSTPPKWAKKLYKHDDKAGFFAAWQKYVERVRDEIWYTQRGLVERIQIMNELNNPFYCSIELVDVAKMADIARKVFKTYDPGIKLMVTVVASNLNHRILRGKSVERFLDLLEPLRGHFDIIGVDYYPGLWHWEDKGWPTPRLAQANFTRLDILSRVFERLASWGGEYELSEVGYTTRPYWGGEEGQRRFYQDFMTTYFALLANFRARGLSLPIGLGIYQAVDELPSDPNNKLLSHWALWPEPGFGLLGLNGKPKMVAQTTETGQSMIEWVIENLRAASAA